MVKGKIEAMNLSPCMPSILIQHTCLQLLLDVSHESDEMSLN